MAQRVKDPEAFVADLVRPFGSTAASAPTADELRKEGEDFVAFAQMFGGSGKLAPTASNGEEV